MKKEYDINNLNPRKNPYSKRLKKQVTINIDSDTIDFFKAQSEDSGIPYQTLINLYLSDCAKQKKQLQMSWKQRNFIWHKTNPSTIDLKIIVDGFVNSGAGGNRTRVRTQIQCTSTVIVSALTFPPNNAH